MSSLLRGEPSHCGAPEGNFKVSQERLEEGGGHWYLSRKEIEENSPSRRDGIDLKKENYLRKSYSKFLQVLGERLKVPQVTIATAIVFCHRFFLRQSHAKNDSRTIAIACIFLAGKVEETPRSLKDVILVSYGIIHEKDFAAVQRIKQKEVYEQKRELILLAERIVLGTLGFDFNIHLPYKPLVKAIKKFKVAQNALAQVAWNFVNDGLRTSLYLQFQPHQIAAGALFLAAKRLQVKLPSDGGKPWWQELGITPRQLEEYCNQMLELYEEHTVPFQAGEAEGIAEGGRPLSKAPANKEHLTSCSSHLTSCSSSHEGATSKGSFLHPAPSRPAPDEQCADNHSRPTGITQSRNNEYGSSENNIISDRRGEDGINDLQHCEQEATPCQGNSGETQNRTEFGIEGHGEADEEGNSVLIEPRSAGELKDKYHGKSLSNKDVIAGQPPRDATKRLDREKLKSAFERRKARGDITHKVNPMDELERELEDVLVAGDNEKTKRGRKQSWSKPSTPDDENFHHVKGNEPVHAHYQVKKGQSSHKEDIDTVEEGEVEPSDEVETGSPSPRSKPQEEAR